MEKANKIHKNIQSIPLKNSIYEKVVKNVFKVCTILVLIIVHNFILRLTIHPEV